MNDSVRKSLKNILKIYNDLNSNFEKVSYNDDPEKYKRISIALSKYEDTVKEFINFVNIEKNINENKEIIENESDEELIELAKYENTILEEKIKVSEQKLVSLLIPKDDRDDKNVIIEIRGAAGGDEANIFVGDIFKLYSKYAEHHNWKIQLINAVESSSGGYSQIEFFIKGKKVFSKLKYEAGIHRVQRVPETETRGRVHTSTISVAVLPEVDEINIKINQNDLRIDTYRSSGAGGQHVNKTDSAVRITHIPTGTVVTSQDGRSQHSNRETAMKHLKSKLYEKFHNENIDSIQKERSKAVGTGARSEKIRTYNYPQNRITDHRIPISLNKLDIIMSTGYGLDEIINSLITFYQNKLINEIK